VLVDGIGKRLAARGRTGCLLPAIHRASGLIQSFFEDHSPTRRQSLDTGWRNYPRPELHAFIEKSHCAATSSRGDSCRRRPTDPQRLGRSATLPRCDVPQTPPIPQRTVALSTPVTHRFPRRGYFIGREPLIRMSTSLLALSCHSGPVATLETPISARSRSNGSRSLRMSPLFMAVFTSASIAPVT